MHRAGRVDNVKNNVNEIFTTFQAKKVPKIKNAQNLLKFGTCDISNIPISIWMLQNIFIKKIKSAQNLLKFGTFGISNMTNSILILQIFLLNI